MSENIIIQNRSIRYKIIRMSRKTISLQLNMDGVLIIKSPKMLSNKMIMNFIHSKENWIISQYQKRLNSANQRIELKPGATISYLGGELKVNDVVEARRFLIELARSEINKKVNLYSSIMGVTYNRVAIREQKTRWGSCSGKSNLNFNWKLILMPEEILDYVVIHELAHLIEMNHSKRFWQQVEAIYPSFRECIKWLKDNGVNYL